MNMLPSDTLRESMNSPLTGMPVSPSTWALVRLISMSRNAGILLA